MRWTKFSNQDPYIQFNIICAAIIILMVFYFGIFSVEGSNYPIHSMYDFQIPSTGLSRSFSEIIRLNIAKGNAYNPNGLRLFIFIVSQLFLRIGTSVFLFNNRYTKKVILFVDLLITVLLFLPTFGKYIIDSLKYYNA